MFISNDHVSRLWDAISQLEAKVFLSQGPHGSRHEGRELPTVLELQEEFLDSHRQTDATRSRWENI